MGRVARYKKVKKSLTTGGGNADTVGVWGFGDSGRKVKKRSQTSVKLRAQKGRKTNSERDAFDVAPEKDDFALTDLVGSLKRESNPALDELEPIATPLVLAKAKPKAAAIPATVPTITATTAVIDDEQEKLLRTFEKQVEPTKPVVAAEARMPGESKRAYGKRVKLETRQIIQRANKQAHNPEKRQKKKEFLNQKKRKRSAAADFDDADDDHDRNDSSSAPGKLLTGEQAVAERARATQVVFGEQAERPPTFQQLPRGAKKAKTNTRTATASSTKQTASRPLLNEAQIEAESHAMDLMRRKVQAQYAAIKQRRKQTGDFHL